MFAYSHDLSVARAQRLISPGNPAFKIRATELWLLK
jgi:hypothetical protein